jgi:hypothetical protein
MWRVKWGGTPPHMSYFYPFDRKGRPGSPEKGTQFGRRMVNCVPDIRPPTAATTASGSVYLFAFITVFNAAGGLSDRGDDDGRVTDSIACGPA